MGYQRIVGELKGLGITVSATTVRKVLRNAGLGPAGKRGEMTWRQFVRTHARTILAVDFFTVETICSSGCTCSSSLSSRAVACTLRVARAIPTRNG
jgi:hypothetical protein